MIPKPKDTGGEIRRLKRQLVSVFSKWLRLKESNEHGACICFTCGKVLAWDQAQAGHFVRCGKEATRFDERNVHVQCEECNITKGGNLEEYAKQIDLAYGEGTALEIKAKGEVIHLWTKEDLTTLLRKYRESIKLLIQEKYID